MIVYPATIELPAFAQPLGQLPGGEVMRRRTHYVTTNVAGVREYAPGDSFNRIHWPLTARAGRLIVKEFELDPTADIWLFLDMQQEVPAGSIGPAKSSLTLLAELIASNIPAYLVKCGQPLEEALSQTRQAPN